MNQVPNYLPWLLLCAAVVILIWLADDRCEPPK